MNVVTSSYIGNILMTIWAALTGAWRDSGVGKALRSFGRRISRAVQESVLCQFLWREGTLPKSWPESITNRVITFILNIPCAICRWLYRVGKTVWDGSFVFRGVTALCGRPFLLLGLFLAVMLMVPHASWDNRYALMGALALIALFAVGSGPKAYLRLEPGAFGPYYIFFMGFICYAFLASLSWSQSVRFVGFHLAAFLLAVLAVSSVKKYEQLQLVVVLAVAGLTIAALYGCYQGVVGVPVVANQQDMLVNKGMPGRVYSFFDNPNNFAELLAMLMPFTYALFLNAKTWRGRLAAVFSFGVCAVALGYTLSRSSWLGFALATVVFIAFWNWKLIPLLVVLGICCVPLLPETIYNRILTIGNTKDTSTSYRFAIYKASGVLMEDYWFRGVGLGSDILTQTFRGYPPMFDGNFPIHTHNNYLQMWAETGLLGALSFLAMLVYQLKAGTKAFLRCTDQRVRNLLAAALAGFCGILLISVAEYTWFYARNMFTYFFLFGVIAACIKLSKKSAQA
ncbi:MAG: O-antigen ligase family protein [Oscillospiraceae bacterium]|nr:O-antigen ligase family protein [Oscillospiraceae bacterium]